MFNSIKVANSLYFKKVLENNYSKEEISQYDILSASAMDELTRSANNETFGTQEYEEVISCYKVFANSLLNNVIFEDKFNSILNKNSNENMHNIDVVLEK